MEAAGRRSRKALVAALCAVLAVLLPLGATLGVAAAEVSLADTGTLLVTFDEGVSDSEQADAVHDAGGNTAAAVDELDVHAVEVADVAGAVAELESDPRVERVEIEATRRAAQETPLAEPPAEVEGSTEATFAPDGSETLVVDPAPAATQWALDAIDWSASDASAVTIAVLDTGVDAGVGDLAGRVTGATNDPNGHGTALASIAAAAVDGAGIDGVAPGAQILSIAVLDADGVGRDSDVVAGIVEAADAGADVILMGFSGPTFSQALQDAVDYAWAQGSVLVAAAGNDGSSALAYPAANAKVVGVAASDEGDGLWSGSNTGDHLSVAAPGVGIVAGAVGGGTRSVTGTSAASAVAAGVAAALVASDTAALPGTVVGRMVRGADAVAAGARVNLAGSLADTSSDEIVPAGAGAPSGGGEVVADAATMTISLTLGGAAVTTVPLSTTVYVRGASFANKQFINLWVDGVVSTTFTALGGSGGCQASGGNPSFSCQWVTPGTAAANVPIVALDSSSPATGVTTCTGLSGNPKCDEATVSIGSVKADQTITLTSTPSSPTYGGSYTPAVSASSGLAVVITSTTTSVCTVSGGVVTLVGVGTCSLTYSQPGNDSFNAAPNVVEWFSVAAKSVTGAFTAPNKVYDGTTAATIATRSLTGAVSGDDVALAGGTATFADENIGTAKVVTGTGFTLTGATAGKYTLASSTLASTASITAKGLTIAFTAGDKVYDGSTGAAITGRTITGGLEPGDVVTVGAGTATFADENVGTAKTVTAAASGFTLTGIDAGNYAVASVASTTAAITPAAVTVTFTAADKTYDRTTAATVTGASATSGVVSGDAVTVSGGSASFADDNVGTAKTVTAPPASFSLGGADGGNYTIAAVSPATADITPAGLTVTFTASDKTYDGTTAATITGRSITGVISGDAVSVSGGSASFTDSNAGTGKAVNATGFVLSGADAGNYAVATVVSATATVATRPITVTADPQAKTYGTADPDLTYQVTAGSLQGTDAFTGVLGREPGEGVGSYDITVGTLSAGSNYALTFVGDDLQIAARAITVSADAKAKTYGAADPALTYAVTAGSLATGDSFTGALTRAVGEDAGSHAILQGTLSAGPNYDLSYVGANLLIGAADQSITVTSSAPAPGRYGDTYGPTATASSGLTVTISSTTPAVCTISGGVVTFVGVGTCTLELTQAGNGNYNAAPAETQSITVAARQITVTAHAKSATFGDPEPALTYGVTGGPVFGDSLTGALSRDPGTDAGTYDILQGTLSGGSLYDITYVGAALTIAPASQTITVTSTAPSPGHYGDTYVPAAIASSGLPVSITSATPAVCTISAGTVTFVGVGTCTLEFTQAGNGNYTAAPTETQTVTVDPRALAIAADPQSKTYGAGDPALTYAVTAGDLVSGDVLTGALWRTPGEAVGSYAIEQGSLTAGPSYSISYTGASLVIGKRSVTVTFEAADKVYDGTTDATIDGRDVIGEAFGDVLGATGGTASFTDASAANGKPVTASGFTLTGPASDNYEIGSVDPATADITQRSLTLTFTVADKTYDGTTEAVISGGSLSGVVGTDDVALDTDGASANFADAAAGAGKAVTATGFALTGAAAANYSIGTVDPASASILRRSSTVTFTAADKVYDGTTAATITGRALLNVVGTDDVSATGGTATFADKHVASNKTVDASAFTLLGAQAANYSVGSVSSTSASITARPILGSFVAADKVYDGTASASVESQSVSPIDGDDLGLSGGSAAFDDKNVGTGKPVTLTGATLAGADRDNYSLSGVSNDEADITAKPVTASFAAADKVYDATTDADITPGAVLGAVAGDDVELTGGSGTFSDENVGAGKTVTASGFSLGGSDAGNYALDPAPVTAEADITARHVTGSFTAASKAYDGSTAADVLSRSVTAVLADDLVLSGGAATFDDRNAGVDKTVTLTGATLGGDDAGNYVLDGVSTTTAAITPLGITGSFTAADKVYDATTAATIDGRSLSGAVAGDDVQLSGGTATFAGADAGTGIVVSAPLASFSLAGTAAGNYDLTAVSGTAADIAPRPVTVTADTRTKVYGDPEPALTYSITSGSLVGGTLFTGAVSRVAGEDVGSYAIEQGTLALTANYDLTYAGANLTITPRPITVTADDRSKMYGEPDPTLTYQVTGTLVDGDAFTGGITRDAGHLSGTYAIRQGTLALSGNYSLTFVDGTFTITARQGEVAYIGQTVFVSSGSSSTTAQVTLTASASSLGLGGEPIAAGSTVTFTDILSRKVLAANVPLSATANAETATANTIVTLSTGQYGLQSYLIEVRLDGNVINSQQLDADPGTDAYEAAHPIVTAMIPQTINTMQGAGSLAPLPTAAGTYHDATSVAYGAGIKWTSKGTNPQGQILLTLAREDGLYYIKSNSITSVAFSKPGSDNRNKDVTIYTKASIFKIDDGVTTSIDGGISLRMDAHESCIGTTCAPTGDSVGFTVLSSKTGSLYYSNQWLYDAATRSMRTIKQDVDGESAVRIA